MMSRAKARVLVGLIFCFVFVSAGPGAEAQTPSLSGISQASRNLSKWLAGTSRFDSKGIGLLLNSLDDLEISDQATQKTIEKLLKASAGNAKTAGDHLSVLEALLSKLGAALEKAEADLNATGPSLNDLANAETRCQTIEELRAINNSYGEAVDTVRNLPTILSNVEQRARLLENFLSKWSRTLVDLAQDPKVSAFLYNHLGDAILTAEDDAKRASKVLSDSDKINRRIRVLPDRLEQRRENFDANMKNLVEQLARESCEGADEQSQDASLEEARKRKAQFKKWQEEQRDQEQQQHREQRKARFKEWQQEQKRESERATVPKQQTQPSVRKKAAPKARSRGRRYSAAQCQQILAQIRAYQANANAYRAYGVNVNQAIGINRREYNRGCR